MQTFGEKRIRVSFNPSGNETADQIKKVTAELIDLCNMHRLQVTAIDPEAVRLWALAETHFETGAMFAVKAATATVGETK